MRRAAVFSRDPVTWQESLLGVVETEASIGRGSSADLQISELRCGDIHALIQPDPNGGGDFSVIDLGSPFGTYVRGKRVDEARVKPGEVFLIGRHPVLMRDQPPAGSEGAEKHVVDGRAERVRPSRLIPTLNLVTERKLLEVCLYWGDQILDVRTFLPGSRITVGSRQDSTFCVALKSSLGSRTPFPLATYKGGALELRVPAEASGLLWVGSETYSVDTLRHRDAASPEFGDIRTSLRIGDRADIHFGELTVSFRFVLPPDPISTHRRPAFLEEGNRLFFGTITLFTALLLLIFALAHSPNVAPSPEKTLADVPKTLKRVLYNVGMTQQKRHEKAAIGQLNADLQGGRAQGEQGRASAKKEPLKAAAHPKKEAEKPRDRLLAKRDRGSRAVSQKNNPDVVNRGAQSLNHKSNQPSPVDVSAAFRNSGRKSSMETDALAGQKQTGNTVAAIAGGNMGQGRTGEGAGGGGKGVGIGQLSGLSTGGAMGAGDYGLTPAKGKDIPVAETDEISILGGLDQDVIAGIIRRYLPQIQHCYEQQLAGNPRLQGKVTVAFTIGPTGSVVDASVAESSMANPPTESCMIEKIRGWKFPRPRGGGTVGVKYPFLLMSNARK